MPFWTCRKTWLSFEEKHIQKSFITSITNSSVTIPKFSRPWYSSIQLPPKPKQIVISSPRSQQSAGEFVNTADTKSSLAWICMRIMYLRTAHTQISLWAPTVYSLYFLPADLWYLNMVYANSKSFDQSSGCACRSQALLIACTRRHILSDMAHTYRMLMI